MRIVLDTNVLVSALTTRGTPPDLLYEAWVESEFELVTSATQLAELERVLGYSRLRAFVRPVEAETLRCRTLDRHVASGARVHLGPRW